jgi:hypothetical protein
MIRQRARRAPDGAANLTNFHEWGRGREGGEALMGVVVSEFHFSGFYGVTIIR